MLISPTLMQGIGMLMSPSFCMFTLILAPTGRGSRRVRRTWRLISAPVARTNGSGRTDRASMVRGSAAPSQNPYSKDLFRIKLINIVLISSDEYYHKLF